MIVAERGIHTVELYWQVLSFAALQMIVDDLYDQKRIYLRKKNHLNTSRVYDTANVFPDGIIMRIEQRYPEPGGIRFIINPYTLSSGKYVPEELYYPTMDPSIMEHVLNVIKNTFNDREWKIDPQKLTLSRVDLTWNFYLSNEIDLTEIIRLFKHGQRKKTTKLDTFQDKNKDQHSFRMRFSDTTLTVYDKDFQVTQKGLRVGDNANILRVELSMQRRAYMRSLELKDRTDISMDEVLYRLYQKNYDLIHHYIDFLCPCTGKHLPYQKAVKEIENQVNQPDIREKMLYFLEKASRSNNLCHAIEKTKEQYHLGRKGIDRLLKRFDEVDVNPITFQKDSKIKKFLCLRDMF